MIGEASETSRRRACVMVILDAPASSADGARSTNPRRSSLPITFDMCGSMAWRAAAISLIRSGGPGLLGRIYAGMGTDALASTPDDVARILGRPARDFTDYAPTTASTGVWSI